ncbi:MAG: BspA family leucine-rich repeat surface protein, partial [Candidatus Nanosynbacter sp.]|nr:BspA family leucine-rich repeat surface protein [Candidatus Nanosynbacter sp.]
LTTLDLSNFNTSNVTDMYGMFYLYNGAASSDQLETIYVKNDFDTTKLTNYSYMFANRKKLRGGAGSYLADPSTADKSWLRIDDPVHGRPGYFTRKP